MSTEAAERPQTKPFAGFLQEHTGGLHSELSIGLAELVEACRAQGKKGKLSLTLTVAPNKDGVTMMIDGVVKVVAPKPPAEPSLFWADDHGNVMRRDPRQPEIEGLREVRGGQPAADKPEPKVVGA